MELLRCFFTRPTFADTGRLAFGDCGILTFFAESAWVELKMPCASSAVYILLNLSARCILEASLSIELALGAAERRFRLRRQALWDFRFLCFGVARKGGFDAFYGVLSCPSLLPVEFQSSCKVYTARCGVLGVNSNPKSIV